jgi:hypothetical protein
MFAQLTAKAIFWACAIALAFFGIGFLGLALCTALVHVLGAAASYALVGVLFVVPPVIWAIAMMNRKPPPPPAAMSKGSSQVVRALLAAVAKETPWVAIVGAGLAGAVEMFVNRRNPRK